MLPEDAHPEVGADLDPDHAPLLDGFPGTPRHKVKGHDRVLPPKEVKEDPDQIRLSDVFPDAGWPEPLPPQPRVIPVREHLRRNPRHKEHAMSTVTEPQNRTDVTAMKDATAIASLPGGPAEARLTDPATSHEAAKKATGSLRRRCADVLQAFQWQATEYAKVPEECPGMTDDELLDAFARYRLTGSPSGIRTARKDLERAGLIQPRYGGEDTPDLVLRPTRLGNPAIVFDLTEAGSDFDVALHR